MSGFPGALKRTKRQHQQSASCKLYMYLNLLQLKILKGVDRGRMLQSKRKILQKSVGEIFGIYRVTKVWLLVGFFQLSELIIGPVGLAEENWLISPAFRDFDRNSGFLFFSIL